MNQDNTIRDPVLATDTPHAQADQQKTLSRLESELEALSGRISALSERTERLPGEIHRLSVSIGKSVAWLAVPLWVILVVLAALVV